MRAAVAMSAFAARGGMHVAAAQAMLALSERAQRAPVRKVAQLLCEDSYGGRARRGELARGARGRFVERSGPVPVPGARGARVRKRPYRKFYANATPSSHCHVCARTAKSVQFAVCARLHTGLCRKVVCDRCFEKFGWDWQKAIADPQWTCVHCRGVCPEGRSQCYIYSRVNRRRGTKRASNASDLSARDEPASNARPAAPASLEVMPSPQSLVLPPLSPPQLGSGSYARRPGAACRLSQLFSPLHAYRGLDEQNEPRAALQSAVLRPPVCLERGREADCRLGEAVQEVDSGLAKVASGYPESVVRTVDTGVDRKSIIEEPFSLRG